jgi:hypothetical protein
MLERERMWKNCKKGKDVQDYKERGGNVGMGKNVEKLQEGKRCARLKDEGSGNVVRGNGRN